MKNTRHLAKRQRTWFLHQLKVNFYQVDYDNFNEFYLHLLKKVPAPSSSYPISGDDNIDFCKFEDNKIKINSYKYFDNLSEEVYNYSIGGYKPIEKYIKARETLTLNDIMHIQKVISVIEKTIEIQSSIDEVYKKIDN